MPPNICPVCSKTLATKYVLIKHVRTIHGQDMDGNEMVVDELSCSAGQCGYTTLYKSDLKKHQDNCFHTKLEAELQKAQVKWQEEFIKQFEKLHSQLTFELTEEKDAMCKEYEHKLKDNQEQIILYRESIARLQGEKELLSQQLQKLYEQVEKSNDKAHQLVEKAIDRPGIITNNNNNTQQIGSVKITNYLADHNSYVERTDRDFIIQQAKQFFEKYLTDLINGQRALARFVVEHIIRCPETGKYILCCTDTSRKRFIYINHVDEKAEDMFAKLFTERISGPIKEVSHAIFNQIVKKLEAQKQVTSGAFDRGYIDTTIESITSKYLHVLEFDVDDKNTEFIAELSGLLRGPSGV